MAIINRRIPTHYLTCANIIGNATLRGGNHSIADGAMSGDTYLASENDVIAHMGGSSKSDLSAQQGTATDLRAMPNLHQIVDL